MSTSNLPMPASGFSHSGGLVASAPATISLGGTVTNLAGPATLSRATIQGPGTLATTGGVTVNTAFLTGGATRSNAGTVTLASGYISGGAFVNQAGAELDLASGPGTVLSGGTLTNLGTLEAAALVSPGSPTRSPTMG